MDKKTIPEIRAMGEKMKFWEYDKAKTYLTETLHQKGFGTARKKDLVDVILKSGIDLAGKVPDEILKLEG